MVTLVNLVNSESRNELAERKWRWKMRRAIFGGTGGPYSMVALRSKLWRKKCREYGIPQAEALSYLDATGVL